MSSPLAHPLLRAGIADPRLRHHHAFHVLVQLVELLPADGTARAVYQASLALTLHLDRKTVRSAMRGLTKWGYLSAEPPDRTRVRAYALVLPVAADVGMRSPRRPSQALPVLPPAA